MHQHVYLLMAGVSGNLLLNSLSNLMIAGDTCDRLNDIFLGNFTLITGVSGLAIAVIVPFLIFLLPLIFTFPNFLILILVLVLLQRPLLLLR